jgi:hypothetical protein
MGAICVMCPRMRYADAFRACSQVTEAVMRYCVIFIALIWMFSPPGGLRNDCDDSSARRHITKAGVSVNFF